MQSETNKTLIFKAIEKQRYGRRNTESSRGALNIASGGDAKKLEIVRKWANNITQRMFLYIAGKLVLIAFS